MQIYLESYDREIFQNKMPENDYQHEAGWQLVQFALPESFGLKLSIDEGSLNFGEVGKPYLSNRPDIHFNLSHTAGLVACAVGSRPVGIDVEKIRPFPRSVLRKLTEKERIYIQSAEQQDEAFMRVWTMKEACIKLTGEGLAAFERTECIPGQPLPGIRYRQFIWQGMYVVTAMETL
ncbi:MAG: 4'-phosphopantetheinyl transferase family protein [Coprococcus sp.]